MPALPPPVPIPQPRPFMNAWSWLVAGVVVATICMAAIFAPLVANALLHT